MVVVTTSHGALEGELIQDDLVKYYSFKGIPYAAPPLGDLRFQAPQPLKPWEGTRPAKEFGPVCFQFDLVTEQIFGSEDCLYLNVYTPEVAPKEPLPVMVWIHGGGFMSGSGNDDVYGPEFLVRHDVVLVTFNYRLEVLGFLCLDSETVPGNAGMKDQVAALRWVQKNIQNFGGNPNNVTIFGESAGAASVTGHLLSPMSKGLFKRAIAQSGALTCWWSNPYGARKSAVALARKLGCDSDDSTELYEFFKKQPVENLVKVNVPFLLYDVGKSVLELQFAMTPENKYYSKERFLPGEPYELLRECVHDDVDIIIGYNEDEGLFWSKTGADIPQVIKQVKLFDDFLVPRPVGLHASELKKQELGKQMREYYMGKENLSEQENALRLFKYYSFDLFVYGVLQWAKFWSEYRKNNKTYLYKFTSKSARNLMTHFFGARKYLGDRVVVCHADELPYLFPTKMSETKVDKASEEFKLINRMTTLWTNFAKYGNPTPDDSLGARWNSFDSENQRYLDIGNQLKPESLPEKEELEFWENIIKEVYPKSAFSKK